MTLEPHEAKSALWLKLSAHLREKQAAYHGQNEGDLSLEQTQKLRGRIAQSKEILALERAPEVAGDDA